MNPQIQKLINYHCTKEFRLMSRQARKTLHNIADKAVADIPKGEIVLSCNLHDVFMLSYVKQKPVTTGMLTVLPQNYFTRNRSVA
jgi:hypothetical protein